MQQHLQQPQHRRHLGVVRIPPRARRRVILLLCTWVARHHHHAAGREGHFSTLPIFGEHVSRVQKCARRRLSRNHARKRRRVRQGMRPILHQLLFPQVWCRNLFCFDGVDSVEAARRLWLGLRYFAAHFALYFLQIPSIPVSLLETLHLAPS